MHEQAGVLQGGLSLTLQSSRPARGRIVLRSNGWVLARRSLPAVEAARWYRPRLPLSRTGRRTMHSGSRVWASLRVRLADSRGQGGRHHPFVLLRRGRK